MERVFDEALFRGLRVLDGFTAFVYCFAPFSWLEKYRGFKSRRYKTDAAKEAESPAAVKPEILTRVEVHELK
jgi:hypothetical protein